MASKGKNFSKKENNSDKNQGIINGAGEIVEQEIANTLEQNYMPYAMSVIVSRAIPQIDGFKPSQRKLHKICKYCGSDYEIKSSW